MSPPLDRPLRVNLPVYNTAGLRELTQLEGFLGPNDTLMLVSGNVDKPLDPVWLGESLAFLERLPARVLVATAGLVHLERLARTELGNDRPRVRLRTEFCQRA